jgi:Tol biopolymer transport system component
VADDGTLIFTTDEPWLSGTRQLVWLNRSGQITGTIGSPQPRMTSPRLSPDGRRIAVVSGENWSSLDVWVFDAERGSALPLLRNRMQEFEPYWFPDGRRVLFSRYTTGGNRRGAFARSADGLGSEEALFDDYAAHLSSAGNYLLLGWQILPGSKRSYVALTGTNRAPVAFPEQWNNIRGPKLSPDETWMAYESDKDEGGEVCLISFPGFTNRMVLSRGGGKRPQWHPTGSELFYLSGRTLMSVTLKRDGKIQPGEPTKVFDLPDSVYVTSENVESGNPFDVSADGQRFLMMQTVESPAGARPNVLMVENWFEEFREKK